MPVFYSSFVTFLTAGGFLLVSIAVYVVFTSPSSSLFAFLFRAFGFWSEEKKKSHIGVDTDKWSMTNLKHSVCSMRL